MIDFRPGLPYVVIGLVVGLLAFTKDAWFAPLQRQRELQPIAPRHSPVTDQQPRVAVPVWLGWTAFVCAAALAAAATWLRRRRLALAAAAVAIGAIVMTFFTIKSMTNVAAQAAPAQGSQWKNLGAGGFMACIAFALFAAGAVRLRRRLGSRQAAARRRVAPQR